jgi:DNA-binding MarR family transcriptional regulator
MKRRFNVYVTPHHLYKLRRWERQNLPHYGKEAGYLLFLEMARSGGLSSEMLKEFYLSMPYAESTMRLLFRNLESDGWIEMPRNEEDKRVRRFILTDKFISKRDEWLTAVSLILSDSPAGH